MSTDTVAKRSQRARRADGVIDHLSTAERVAMGRSARETVPLASHASWEPQPHRRDPVELLEEQAADAGAGAGSDPVRPDAHLAVRVLPGRRPADGGGSRRYPSDHPAGPALRRRPPLQLRRVRRTGPTARVQRQRLRRDTAGPVRVGPQTSRGQLRRRRPGQRVQREAAGGGEPGRRPLVSQGDERASLRCERSTPGTSRLDADQFRREWDAGATKAEKKGLERDLAKSRTKDSLKAFDKLTRLVDGEPRIISDPPLIVPINDLLGPDQAEAFVDAIRVILRSYRRSLPG